MQSRKGKHGVFAVLSDLFQKIRQPARLVVSILRTGDTGRRTAGEDVICLPIAAFQSFAGSGIFPLAGQLPPPP